MKLNIKLILFSLGAMLSMHYAIGQIRTINTNTMVLKTDPKLKRVPNVTIKKDTKPKIINTAGLKNIGLVKYYPIKPAPGSTERLGSDITDITKQEDIKVLLQGDQYQSFFEKLNIFHIIFEDKNAKSNVYYYFPDMYTLKWDKETNDYDFNIYYMSSDEGKGSVLINTQLSPQISTTDIKLAEQLLSAKLGKSIKLMPMPLRDVPEVNFGATLTNFNVSPESINASIPSDYHKPIKLDWRMDSNVDDFVGAMLNKIGVNINLDLRPYGDDESVISIPVNLEVNSPVTYGKISFDNTNALASGWINNLDYPVIPKNLILIRKNGAYNYFQSIPLESIEIGLGETYLPDAAAKTKIGNANNVAGLWMDYAINNDCNVCNQTVKKKIIGGTSGSQLTKLDIQILNALEYSKAHSFKLNIKSIQADPNGINEIEFPAMTIAEDGVALETKQLFVPEGDELSYQYQLIMINNDGSVKESAWKQSNSNLLVLGENQIKELFKIKEKSELEKAKDSLISDTKDDLIEKGKELLGSLLGGKKKDKEDQKEDN